LVTRYALAYPNVRFKVTDGKQVTLQTAGDGDRRAILPRSTAWTLPSKCWK
jgi:hypothetical protein